ncbi:MAG: hypothetical protein MZW92_41580 [Comamonadaceae bacterium]|nr:hypothetical protein [Comamonadaceae bacterium]
MSAARGYITDVIEPADTRATVAAGAAQAADQARAAPGQEARRRSRCDAVRRTPTPTEIAPMKTYTTLDAIGDMFVIYGIVIVISMLVAVVDSRHRLAAVAAGDRRSRGQGAGQARARRCNPRAAGIPQEHLAVIAAAVRRDDGRAPHRPHRDGQPRLRSGPPKARTRRTTLARAARIALSI